MDNFKWIQEVFWLIILSNSTVFTGAIGVTYTLRWTISNYTCISSDEVIISFPFIAERPLNFLSAPTPVCQGTAGNIYTVPNTIGVTYNWSYSGTGCTINGTGNSVSIDFDATCHKRYFKCYSHKFLRNKSGQNSRYHHYCRPGLDRQCKH